MFVNRIVFFLLIVGTLPAGESPYWIFLDSDTKPTTVQLSLRAEQRIAIRASTNPAGSWAVSEIQLAHLREAGFQIRHSSRFLNAVSVMISDQSQLLDLEKLPFIRSISPVARRPQQRIETVSYPTTLPRNSTENYGQSQGQNELLKIPHLHSFGYDGTGVMIGVFDTGFLTEHPIFDQADIHAQYDFVDHETDASGPGHEHGINVLSVLGGYYPGELIGPAHGSTFLLARTENVLSESRAEEDNWVAALEWADSLGVDIITTSLNYFQEFTDPNEDYPISALDGQTTIIARAANIAAQRGILVVNSAGNEGPSASSIWPPSDSRHVLSVGAIDSYQDITSFSSRGPTFDGRIKPNVVAQGSLVYMAAGINGFRNGDGTSFAAPQIAGLAALLLQAHPQLLPDSLISIFQDFGDNAQSPNNTYGWGIPDITSLFPNQSARDSKNCLVFPNPGSYGEIRMVLSDPISDLPEVATLYNIQGREIATLKLTQETGSVVKVSIPSNLVISNQLMVLFIKSNNRSYAGKFVFLKS